MSGTEVPRYSKIGKEKIKEGNKVETERIL